MLFFISTLPLPLLTRVLKGLWNCHFCTLSLLLGDKLDLHVSCECAREGGEGEEDLKWNVSSQLWVLMLCVVQLIMQTLPSKIFLGRCLKWYLYKTATLFNTATDSNKSSVSFFFYLENPFNMLLLLIQSDFCCLVVTRLTGFHCNLKLLMSVGCFLEYLYLMEEKLNLS